VARLSTFILEGKIVREQIRSGLVLFSADERKQIIGFLDKGFCLDAEILICAIFVGSQVLGKKLPDVMAACEKEWKENWSGQKSESRGSIETEGCEGDRNRRSFEHICRTVGLPQPNLDGE